uniref:Cytotoxic translational repressor of toxin-antitoxin stability system n=1 Tax=Panagrellus redivivus TaxID=6233 RepID=A0A7E4ZXN3_PANRE
MSYPINTLPYPFKKRLRQLLTPVELYQLQKATGRLDKNHHLLPIMKVRKCRLLFTTTTPDDELIVQWQNSGPYRVNANSMKNLN